MAKFAPADDTPELARKPHRAAVIGLDSAVPERWLKFAESGDLPNLAALLQRGVNGTRCHVPFPTLTPPNWASISTGAMPATHGVTDFHMHTPGDPLDHIWQAFDEAPLRAERLWTAWAKAQAASIVINYVGAWPPSVENGLQIGGHGIDINEWRTRDELGYSSGDAFLVTLAGCDLISTEGDPLAIEASNWREASGWDLQPENALEIACRVRFRRAKTPVQDERFWHILSHPGGVRVAFGRRQDEALAELKVGEWSPVVRATFETAEGVREIGFCLKLLEHDHEQQTLRLFISPLCEWGADVWPEDWVDRLRELPGLPLPMSDAWEAHELGWIDSDTLFDLEEMEHEWVGSTIELATEMIDWSLLMFHDHGPDWFGHVMFNGVDPDLEPDQATRAETERLELRLYQSLDRLIGRIADAAGPGSVITVVSDHGAIPTGPTFNTRVVLEQAGLLTYGEEKAADEQGFWDGVWQPSEDPVYVEARNVDWSRTKAVPQRSSYVYVNLKGRDPTGIIEPGAEYEKVCDEIITALVSYVDPATGRRPVSLALRRRDAQILGLPDDDTIGDVVYAIDPPYGIGHAQQLPSVAYGAGSLAALFVIAGPGVKQGIELDRRIGLEDIAPTLSYLLQLPVPRDADGGIIYQALEDPNMHLSELRSLQNRNQQLEKVRKVYEKGVAITHSYNQ